MTDIRVERPADCEAIYAVNEATFGSPGESGLVSYDPRFDELD
jgi:predicted N-acetyltransferase YhbS